MRQAAWLAAIPDSAAHEKQNRASRIERLRQQHKDDEYEPEMPPLSGAAHVVAYLYEVGPVIAAGMGAGPITHVELRSWARLIGVKLRPWEARFIRRLSAAYLVELHAAEQPDRPSPWGAVRAQHVARTMREQIAALANL